MSSYGNSFLKMWNIYKDSSSIVKVPQDMIVFWESKSLDSPFWNDIFWTMWVLLQKEGIRGECIVKAHFKITIVPQEVAPSFQFVITHGHRVAIPILANENVLR